MRPTSFTTDRDFEITVSGDYQPEEAQTLEYPGCRSHWENLSLTIRGVKMPVYDSDVEWMSEELDLFKRLWE